MTLSGIEIVVGEPSEKLPTRRRLNYIVSFKNDAGEKCQQRHDEQAPMIRRASRRLLPMSCDAMSEPYFSRAEGRCFSK
jgi:hypothetical protein